MPYKDARGQTSTEDAVGKGLLLPQEAAVLEPLPSRTQVIPSPPPHLCFCALFQAPQGAHSWAPRPCRTRTYRRRSCS